MKKAFSKKNSIENSILLYVLLFLACLNFVGRGPIIFLLFCIFAWIKAYNFKLCWDINAICYLFMSLFASIASILYFSEKEVFKSLVYFFAFAAGYKGYSASQDKLVFIQRIIFSAFAGYIANLLITYYTNFIVLGHVSGQRELYNFWTKDLMSVTLTGLMSSIPIAYSAYCFFCKKDWRYKALGIISIVVVAILNMGTATRTPFVLTGVVYLCIIFELFRDKSARNKGSIFFFVLIAVYLLFSKILPILSNSAIGERFADEGMNTSRTDITLTYINNMFDYPFGGSMIYAKTKLLAHNFIFEAYDMYGFIFFIFTIILFIQIIGRIFRLHKVEMKNDVTFLLLSIYISAGIQVMLEPVIGGYPQLIWTLFLIDGMTIQYLKDGLFRARTE